MADSIFPFIDPEELNLEETSEVPLATEWAWDFEEQDFKTRNGKMYLVEESEAVKIWLWKLFNTARFRYLIFDWDYGQELEELIGQGYTEGYLESEAERYIREAIEYNLEDYVLDIGQVDLDFTKGTLTVSFVAETIYGEVAINV